MLIQLSMLVFGSIVALAATAWSMQPAPERDPFLV